MLKRDRGILKSPRPQLIIFLCILLSGCVDGANSTNKENQNSSYEEELESDYQLKQIEMSKKEVQTVQEKIEKAGEIITPIYQKGNQKEENLHEMVALIGQEGDAVTCGNHDYNMQNYQQVERAIKKGAALKAASAEFYVVVGKGDLRYYLLEFDKGSLAVTSASAAFGESMTPEISYLEKIEVYSFEYTEKGWLIWEKALSRNEEMDMHMIYRILPLDEMCIQMNRQFIRPVGYFYNNLFLTEWDAQDMSSVVFNDLFEFLYKMKYGEKMEFEKYSGGIPKVEFETVIQEYFEIPIELLEQQAGYNANTGTYPWVEIGRWNRTKPLQSFPEVVKCITNEDGSITLSVEAVRQESGRDCIFRHEVRMRKTESGKWIYLGNKLDEGYSSNAPGYKPRVAP